MSLLLHQVTCSKIGRIKKRLGFLTLRCAVRRREKTTAPCCRRRVFRFSAGRCRRLWVWGVLDHNHSLARLTEKYRLHKGLWAGLILRGEKGRRNRQQTTGILLDFIRILIRFSPRRTSQWCLSRLSLACFQKGTGHRPPLSGTGKREHAYCFWAFGSARSLICWRHGNTTFAVAFLVMEPTKYNVRTRVCRWPELYTSPCLCPDEVRAELYGVKPHSWIRTQRFLW